MHILVVLDQPPTLEGGAGAKCALGLLRGLQAHGVEPTVIAAALGDKSTVGPPSDLNLEVVRVPRLPPWSYRWRRLRAPRSILGQGSFGERVRELAADADLLHLDEIDAAAARQDLIIPSVVRLHYLTALDRDMGWPLRSSARDWLEFRAAERRAVSRNRRLIANSPEMGTALRRIAPRSEIVVAPLALDASAYEHQASLDEPVAGLIGTAVWPPTDNAVRRLVSHVWPRVRRLVPGARLRLAGRGLELANFANVPGADAPDVEWLGHVDSAEEFMRGLSVLVYPVTRGSGTKIKVLEALALGVPVVTTSAGAEGLGARGGVAVLSTDEDLAAAAARLLREPELRAAEGLRARETFLAHHTPAVAAAPLIELYERILG